MGDGDWHGEGLVQSAIKTLVFANRPCTAVYTPCPAQGLDRRVLRLVTIHA
jgi:hypothetical protein